ncbi:MAG: GAF domain-containing sensor histidine kinase [Chloroflexota bacterium]|nr:GAF domain-containing sensor histidine kinase [Chloroflexota bacterium]
MKPHNSSKTLKRKSSHTAKRRSAQDPLPRCGGLDASHVTKRAAEIGNANARLALTRAERESGRLANEFIALSETIRDLATPQDLRSALQSVVERVANLLAAPFGVIYLYNSDKDDLEVAATNASLFPNRTLSDLVQAIAKRVIETQRPVKVDNYRTWEDQRSELGIPVTAVLQVPIHYGTKTLGVLGVAEIDNLTHKFTQVDARLLSLFAAQAAIAIYNVNLIEQVSASRKQREFLSRRLLQTLEMERRKIALELHDEIGQAMTGVQLNLQAIEPLLTDAAARRRLEETMLTIEQVLHQVRDLSLDLHPSLLDDFGLVAALRWYVKHQADRAGLTWELVADAIEPRPSVDIETACYRVTQEALTNVIRHARASHIVLTLKKHNSELELIIEDNGAGFDVPAALKRAADGASMGLLGIKERVAYLGGRADIESASAQGTRIRARFPLTFPLSYLERRVRKRNLQ